MAVEKSCQRAVKQRSRAARLAAGARIPTRGDETCSNADELVEAIDSRRIRDTFGFGRDGAVIKPIPPMRERVGYHSAPKWRGWKMRRSRGDAAAREHGASRKHRRLTPVAELEPCSAGSTISAKR